MYTRIYHAFRLLTALGLGLALMPAVSWASGTSTSTSTYTAGVLNSVTIITPVNNITQGSLDFFSVGGQLSAFAASGSFSTEANDSGTVYDVWVGLTSNQSDPNVSQSKSFSPHIAVATDGSSHYLPLVLHLSGPNSVSANPGALTTPFGQPVSGDLIAGGYGESGANLVTQQTFTVSATTDTAHIRSDYPDIPAGAYSLSLTVNVFAH